MSQVNPTQNGTLPSRLERFDPTSTNGRAAPPHADAARRIESDSVDLSSEARRLDSQRDTTPIRAELVARIRAEIAAGTYETSERLDQAAHAIARELTD